MTAGTCGIPSGILTPSACCSRGRSSTIRGACSGKTIGSQDSANAGHSSARSLQAPFTQTHRAESRPALALRTTTTSSASG